MTDKDRLQKLYELGKVSKINLCFGSTMPLGKYKGRYIYHLLVKHHRYMDWLTTNGYITLTETESWWKQQIDTFIELRRADNLIAGLACCTLSSPDILPNIDNPYRK